MLGLLLFILGLIIGVIAGFVILAFFQLSSEEGYVKKGVAKLYGNYYTITPLEVKKSD